VKMNRGVPRTKRGNSFPVRHVNALDDSMFTSRVM